MIKFMWKLLQPILHGVPDPSLIFIVMKSHPREHLIKLGASTVGRCAGTTGVIPIIPSTTWVWSIVLCCSQDKPWTKLMWDILCAMQLRPPSFPGYVGVVTLGSISSNGQHTTYEGFHGHCKSFACTIVVCLPRLFIMSEPTAGLKGLYMFMRTFFLRH